MLTKGSSNSRKPTSAEQSGSTLPGSGPVLLQGPHGELSLTCHPQFLNSWVFVLQFVRPPWWLGLGHNLGLAPVPEAFQQGGTMTCQISAVINAAVWTMTWADCRSRQGQLRLTLTRPFLQLDLTHLLPSSFRCSSLETLGDLHFFKLTSCLGRTRSTFQNASLWHCPGLLVHMIILFRLLRLRGGIEVPVQRHMGAPPRIAVAGGMPPRFCHRLPIHVEAIRIHMGKEIDWRLHVSCSQMFHLWLNLSVRMFRDPASVQTFPLLHLLQHLHHLLYRALGGQLPAILQGIAALKCFQGFCLQGCLQVSCKKRENWACNLWGCDQQTRFNGVVWDLSNDIGHSRSHVINEDPQCSSHWNVGCVPKNWGAHRVPTF